MDARPPVIEVRGLTKTFRTYKKPPGLRGALKGLFSREHEDVHAARDITFTVREGEFVGFLGPNGAGKTTTLKMLAGLLYPTSGEARVLGFVPWERADGYRRQFALLLGQKNQLWWDLPASESLALNARIYGLPKADADRTVADLADLLDVAPKLNTMVRELSLGERLTCELIAALLPRPRVLFRDEPTIGLDVVSQQRVREFLREYNSRHHTTILLTSHYMADIEALCERVVVVDRGTLFFDGPLAEMTSRFMQHKLITVRTEGACPEGRNLTRYGEVLERTSAGVKLKVPRARVVPVCKALLDELPVHDLDIEEVPIEEVIRQIFAREAAAA
ncbi:MAG: ATP-binding cassette domain-containing protein [Limisphaerales bacterium]